MALKSLGIVFRFAIGVVFICEGLTGFAYTMAALSVSSMTIVVLCDDVVVEECSLLREQVDRSKEV